MQSDLFHCPSCKESYDLELRIQKALLSCSHYLCLSCLRNILASHSVQEPQCPSCKACFPSTHLTPEAFPTNRSLFEILRRKAKAKLGYCQEHDCSLELFCITDQLPICKYCDEYGNHKGHKIQPIRVLQDKTVKKRDKLKELLKDNVQKKKKGEQEIADKLTKMQELVINQFFEMRKILHLKQAEISQSIEVALKAENETLMNAYSQNKTMLENKMAEGSQSEYGFITTEDCDNYENYFPLAEINNKLEEVLTETQTTMNRFLKTIDALKLEPTQINEVSTQTLEGIPKPLQHEASTQTVQEISKLSEQIPLKKEALSQLEQTQENRAFDPQVVSDEMEEEFAENYQSFQEKVQGTKGHIMEIEAESQLKLDLSNAAVSDEAFITLFSEDFWDRTEKKKICHLEVNFSASSILDKQFATFVLNIMNHLENLTSILIDIADTKISNESLQVLSQECLKNYKLKSFLINCSGTSIGYEGIKSLEDGLNCSIQTLGNIEIILDFTSIQGEEFMDALLRMEQLKNLKLSFENSRISSEIVSSIVFYLRYFAQNLESLDLNFNGTEVDDEKLESFLNHAIFYLRKLKHLKLGLGGTLVSDDLLSYFFQSLKVHALRLITFELDLHSTRLTNEAFKYFCKGALSEMVNLENLKLNLSQTKIDDVSLKNMLLPVRKLKSLTLILNKINLSDSSLNIFKENNNLKNLETFHFHFEQTQISDKTLQDFLSHLSKERQNSRDLRPNLTLRNLSVKHNLHPKLLQAKSEASSEYSSDTENHPVLNDDFNPKNKAKMVIPLEKHTKKQIIVELRKAIFLEKGITTDPIRYGYSELLHLIQSLELEKYDKILRKVLTQNLPNPKSIPQDLEQWRKKILLWTKSFVRGDFKGNKSSSDIPPKARKRCSSSKPHERVFSKYWLQKYGQEISFREKVIEILKSMSSRSWVIFHERVLKSVKELSHDYKKWEMPLEAKTFWWYNFMQKEKEVADLWKSLPIIKEEYNS